MNVVRFNGTDHVVHLRPTAHQCAPHRADMHERFQDARLALGIRAPKEANNADHSLELDAVEALLEGSAASNLDNVVHARVVAGKLASRLSPVGVCLVVENVVSAKLL